MTGDVLAGDVKTGDVKSGDRIAGDVKTGALMESGQAHLSSSEEAIPATPASDHCAPLHRGGGIGGRSWPAGGGPTEAGLADLLLQMVMQRRHPAEPCGGPRLDFDDLS